MGVIDDPKILRQAEQLAALRGVSVEEAIRVALSHELERDQPILPIPARKKGSMEEALAIIKHYQSLPKYDTRSAEEILGYNDIGVPE